MGNKTNKQDLLSRGLDDTMNPSVEAIICALPGHLNNTNIKNEKEATKYVAALLNGDLIDAGGVANDPDQKREMMKRIDQIEAGIGVVIAGDEMEKKNISHDDVANNAIIIQQTKDLTSNGGFEVNGVRTEMNEEAKNTELARRFVNIMTKCGITKAFNRAKQAAMSVYKFLSIKVKGLSDRWKQVIEKQNKKCDMDSERLVTRLGIRPQQAYSGGPSR